MSKSITAEIEKNMIELRGAHAEFQLVLGRVITSSKAVEQLVTATLKLDKKEND